MKSELFDKKIAEMTGSEFLLLISEEKEKKYVYGIKGIADLFNCAIPTANRIKASGKIDKAITQIGRKIVIDAEYALELAGKSNKF